MGATIKTGFVGFVCLVGLAVLLSLASPKITTSLITVVDNWNHSPKHDKDILYTSVDVDNCFNKSGPMLTLKEGKSKFIELCQLEKDKFGVRVWREIGSDKLKTKVLYRKITAYWKQELKSFEDIAKYITENKLEVVDITIK